MRKAAALLVAVAVAAVVGGTARFATASAARSCPARSTRAVVAGKTVCLKPGARCKRAHAAQYRRHGFVCRASGRLARAAEKKTKRAAPTPTTTAAATPPAPATVTLTVTGGDETVYDWTTQRCAYEDYPDLPVRAFRDASGNVQLLQSTDNSRRFVGPDLDHLSHPCSVVLASDYNADASAFDDAQWVAAPYTLDGKTVYALLHQEHHGWAHSGQCSVTGAEKYTKCWYNAVTFAVSTDGGATYQDAPRPGIVATVPHPYTDGTGMDGIFTPSNIVHNAADGFFYAMGFMVNRGVTAGTCLFRTKTLADPTSWRAWDGVGFGVSFVDPYGPNPNPDAHLCTPLVWSPQDLQPNSITWNTVARQWLLVGQAAQGAYYALSPDLVHWTTPTLFYKRQVTWNYTCGDPDPIAYEALLDPSSTSRNFETSGSSAYLYFTLFHYTNCQMTGDRDLVRVPVSITAP